jgi:phosphoribosylamine--glycine ligase
MDAVKVLLVGSGGREHALAWKLAQAPTLTELHAAPGNPGIATLGACHPVRAEDGEGLLALARALAVDLVVVGPEAPLVDGVADDLRHAGIAVFGPSRAAARIEGSKLFAKDVLRTTGVATAETLAVAHPPCVLKADGLAAGKGVFVCRTAAELAAGLDAVASYGRDVLIEELLRSPSPPRRTSSAPRRAIAVRTRAAWARTPRSRSMRRRSSTSCTVRFSPNSPHAARRSSGRSTRG